MSVLTKHTPSEGSSVFDSPDSGDTPGSVTGLSISVLNSEEERQLIPPYGGTGLGKRPSSKPASSIAPPNSRTSSAARLMTSPPSAAFPMSHPHSHLVSSTLGSPPIRGYIPGMLSSGSGLETPVTPLSPPPGAISTSTKAGDSSLPSDSKTPDSSGGEDMTPVSKLMHQRSRSLSSAYSVPAMVLDRGAAVEKGDGDELNLTEWYLSLDNEKQTVLKKASALGHSAFENAVDALLVGDKYCLSDVPVFFLVVCAMAETDLLVEQAASDNEGYFDSDSTAEDPFIAAVPAATKSDITPPPSLMVSMVEEDEMPSKKKKTGKKKTRKKKGGKEDSPEFPGRTQLRKTASDALLSEDSKTKQKKKKSKKGDSLSSTTKKKTKSKIMSKMVTAPSSFSSSSSKRKKAGYSSESGGRRKVKKKGKQGSSRRRSRRTESGGLIVDDNEIIMHSTSMPDDRALEERDEEEDSSSEEDESSDSSEEMAMGDIVLDISTSKSGSSSSSKTAGKKGKRRGVSNSSGLLAQRGVIASKPKVKRKKKIGVESGTKGKPGLKLTRASSDRSDPRKAADVSSSASKRPKTRSGQRSRAVTSAGPPRYSALPTSSKSGRLVAPSLHHSRSEDDGTMLAQLTDEERTEREAAIAAWKPPDYHIVDDGRHFLDEKEGLYGDLLWRDPKYSKHERSRVARERDEGDGRGVRRKKPGSTKAARPGKKKKGGTSKKGAGKRSRSKTTGDPSEMGLVMKKSEDGSVDTMPLFRPNLHSSSSFDTDHGRKVERPMVGKLDMSRFQHLKRVSLGMYNGSRLELKSQESDLDASRLRRVTSIDSSSDTADQSVSKTKKSGLSAVSSEQSRTRKGRSKTTEQAPRLKSPLKSAASKSSTPKKKKKSRVGSTGVRGKPVSAARPSSITAKQQRKPARPRTRTAAH